LRAFSNKHGRRAPLWKTRSNLHPSYIAKLSKNSESWRINPIYRTSEETCAHSPRALNGWRLISKPNADTVRLGIETTSKVGQRIARISPYDAADCRAGNTLFVGHVRQLKAVLGAARRQSSMEEPRSTLLDQTASIIGRWRESCENWPVNFSFLAHGKSYSTLPPGSSEEPTA
jgi:hypothetical protein